MNINASAIVLSCFRFQCGGSRARDAHRRPRPGFRAAADRRGQSSIGPERVAVRRAGRTLGANRLLPAVPGSPQLPERFRHLPERTVPARVGATAPAGGAVQRANPQTSADAARLQQLLAEYNRLVAIQNAQAGRGTVPAGWPNTIGGTAARTLSRQRVRRMGRPRYDRWRFQQPRSIPARVDGQRWRRRGTTAQDIAAMTGANFLVTLVCNRTVRLP